MQYYAGTTVELEWTAQHACGDFVAGQSRANAKGSNVRLCEMVLQYMCLEDNSNLRDGNTEATPPLSKVSTAEGQHEPYDYYVHCANRPRNKGLFTADRRLRGETAIYTRQNNDGDRHGYECPEERDYYPYWHPTPWRDIAILTNDASRCPYYKRESQNVRNKGYCTAYQNTPEACRDIREPSETQRDLLDDKAWITNSIGWWIIMREKADLGLLANSEKPAFADSWTEVQKLAEDSVHGLAAYKAIFDKNPIGGQGTWEEKGAFNLPPPDCQFNDWSRDNHLGNGLKRAEPVGYNWTIPQSIVTNGPNKCVFRLRYNMTSSDYDHWNTHSWANYDFSVIKNNPKVEDPAALQLTMNTNQYSRVFQDRSHVFQVLPVPATFKYPDGAADVTVPAGAKIHNLNVRGKRGNIVQAYPAVEYDFKPQRLYIKAGDFVHFQWTGSNTNPENYAGQGTRGTDRNNIMQVALESDNIPLPQEKVTMWGDATDPVAINRYKFFALLGQSNPLLNEASAYINYPPIQFNKPGTYSFICTRNNNFSNRSQKGQIVVKA
eukprot:TRINITY_DN26803_c0_g1_i1.p1 TRINITY_DN26803_c0_g1~~TRINITY_DN26803_c0_g1_i1.p1  ORF type:complete len:623 (-),score=99.35 TRINITY_DN26803_c0_g1_i1:88-1734(-)